MEANIMKGNSQIIHLRFGIVVTDHKHCRFVIARIYNEEYPLVD